MENPRPKLALLVSKAPLRIRLVASLSAAYRVQVIDSAEGAVRAFRAQRPQVVLLCAKAREVARMGAVARALKTEQRPPIVGLIAVAGLPPEPEAFLEEHLLDGLCALPNPESQLVDWVLLLRKGERPISGELAQRRSLRGALRRISGSRVSSKDE